MSGEMLKKSVLLLLAGAVVGALLLTIAYMLPVNSANKSVSLETLESEGWYPRASVAAAAYDTYINSAFPDVLDGMTDRTMLCTAMDTGEGNPFLRAMDSYNEYNGHYSYYWHGYVCVLRPLLLLFDYSEIRVLNGICQFLLILLLMFVIGKEKGIRYVLMLGTSCLLLSPAAVSMCLQFTWVFYIACLGTLILLLKREYFSAHFRYVYFFITLGMLTSYCDLLTYPLFTWGMPLVWWLIMDKAPVHADVKGGRTEALFYVKRVIASGFAWIAGYAGMWVMKWAIASPALGRNIFIEAIYEVFLRAGAMEKDSFGLMGRLEIIGTNWKHYGYGPYAVLLACWLLWWFWNSLKNGGYRSGKRYAYFLTGVSSIVWYFVLSNHVQAHHFFTYRIFGVSILAFLALVLDSLPPVADQRPEGEHTGGNTRIEKKKVCCVWVAAVLLSIPFMLLEREDSVALNGYAEFKTVPIPQDAIVEAEFKPAYNHISRLDMGMECQGAQGEYEIILWDGEKARYREVIPVRDDSGALFGEYYHVLDVSWRLNPKKTYRLTIEVKNTDAPASLWVTENKQGPMAEYGSLSVGGEAVEGQPLSAVTYHYLPLSKRRLLFLSLTWTGILAAAMYTFGQGLFRRAES